jgi:hypothetical protein
MRYTSPHDEPWFSDPDCPSAWSRTEKVRDPDRERDRLIDDEIDETESSIRTCKACGMTARIRDGKHDGCINGWIRNEIKAILELMPSNNRQV